MLTNLNDIVTHLLVLYYECVFSTYCILHFCILALHQLNCTYGLICDIHEKSSIDPLTTDHYRWHNLNINTYMAMPVSSQNNPSSDNIYDNYNNIVYGEIDDSHIDYNVDPGINFIMSNKHLDCKWNLNLITHFMPYVFHVSCKYSQHTTKSN